MDSQMDGQTEWRESPNQHVPSTSSKLEEIKTFCGEISQYLKKCSPYILAVTVFQPTYCHQKEKVQPLLKVVYSYAYYGHFMFPLRLFRIDMNVTR